MDSADNFILNGVSLVGTGTFGLVDSENLDQIDSVWLIMDLIINVDL